MQEPKQPDEVNIGSTRFDCHCGKPLDQVYLDTDSVSLSWFACPHCGWDDCPERYEPSAWYENRYDAN